MHLTQDIEAAFNTRFSALLSATGDAPVAVCVSGGGDSTALLVLAAKWRDRTGRPIHAVSVNHGLRPEAVTELDQVAALSNSLNVPHTVLNWTGWDRTGNLQDKARAARRSLINQWARENGVNVVATGHNRDDQAETFLMRLARGSGVDGLSAMYAAEDFDHLTWLKPLLDMPRDDLRGYLQAADISWSEDPTNKDRSFERVRFRQAAEMLSELGLDAKTLSNTAERLKSARHALEIATQELARRAVTVTPAGTVRFDRVQYSSAPFDLQQRLMAHAVRWVSQQTYVPRLSAVQQALAAMNKRRHFTLNGCLLTSGKSAFAELCREAAAVSSHPAKDGVFDHRWQVDLTGAPDGSELRPLGDRGLSILPDWRDTDHSRWALLSSPSLWQKDELIAAPFVFTSDICKVSLHPEVQNFYTSIVTH